MKLQLENCTIRSWQPRDAPDIVPHADNRKVWRNLRDAFPHPYTLSDAERFIQHAREQEVETLFALEVDGSAAGGIGISLHRDVERVSAELGYWLGERHWGRGITTEAVRALTAWAIEAHGLTRVYALPFAWNPASCRVLEKAGFRQEARLRRAVIKEGRIIDQFLYAFVVEP